MVYGTGTPDGRPLESIGLFELNYAPHLRPNDLHNLLTIIRPDYVHSIYPEYGKMPEYLQMFCRCWLNETVFNLPATIDNEILEDIDVPCENRIIQSQTTDPISVSYVSLKRKEMSSYRKKCRRTRLNRWLHKKPSVIIYISDSE